MTAPACLRGRRDCPDPEGRELVHPESSESLGQEAQLLRSCLPGLPTASLSSKFLLALSSGESSSLGARVRLRCFARLDPPLDYIRAHSVKHAQCQRVLSAKTHTSAAPLEDVGQRARPKAGTSRVWSGALTSKPVVPLLFERPPRRAAGIDEGSGSHPRTARAPAASSRWRREQGAPARRSPRRGAWSAWARSRGAGCRQAWPPHRRPSW